MRYAVVCDTRKPDFALIDTKKMRHGTWYTYPSIPSLSNTGDLRQNSAAELIANPDTAARLLMFETDSYEELKDFCANFPLTHPEYYI